MYKFSMGDDSKNIEQDFEDWISDGFFTSLGSAMGVKMTNGVVKKQDSSFQVEYCDPSTVKDHVELIFTSK